MNVTSQYFNKISQFSTRRTISILTSKLKNKFRQKDDPRRVFDRHSNQIRRQKRNLGKLDAELEGANADFPSLKDQRTVDMDGHVEINHEINEEDRWNSDENSYLYMEADLEEDLEPVKRGERIPQFSTFEEEDNYYVSQMSQDDDHDIEAARYQEDENIWKEPDLRPFSLGKKVDAIAADPWEELAQVSTDTHRSIRRISLFHIMSRGAFVQSILIWLTGPILILTPTLIAVILSCVVKSINMSERIFESGQCSSGSAHWAFSYMQDNNSYTNRPKIHLFTLIQLARNIFVNPAKVLEFGNVLRVYIEGHLSWIWGLCRKNTFRSIVGISLVVLKYFLNPLLRNTAVVDVERVIDSEFQKSGISVAPLGVARSMVNVLSANVNIFCILMTSACLVLGVGVNLGVSAAVPIAVVFSNIFIDFYIFEALRCCHPSRSMISGQVLGNLEFERSKDVLAGHLTDSESRGFFKGKGSKKIAGTLVATTYMAERKPGWIPYWYATRHISQSVLIACVLFWAYRSIVDEDYSAAQFEPLIAWRAYQSFFSHISSWVSSLLSLLGLKDFRNTEVNQLIVNILCQLLIPLILWSQYLGNFNDFYVDNVDTADSALNLLASEN